MVAKWSVYPTAGRQALGRFFPFGIPVFGRLTRACPFQDTISVEFHVYEPHHVFETSLGALDRILHSSTVNQEHI